MEELLQILQENIDNQPPKLLCCSNFENRTKPLKFPVLMVVQKKHTLTARLTVSSEKRGSCILCDNGFPVGTISSLHINKAPVVVGVICSVGLVFCGIQSVFSWVSVGFLRLFKDVLPDRNVVLPCHPELFRCGFVLCESSVSSRMSMLVRCYPGLPFSVRCPYFSNLPVRPDRLLFSGPFRRFQNQKSHGVVVYVRAAVLSSLQSIVAVVKPTRLLFG